MRIFNNLILSRKLFVVFSSLVLLSIFSTILFIKGIGNSESVDSNGFLISLSIISFIFVLSSIIFFTRKITEPVTKLISSIDESAKLSENKISVFNYNDEISKLSKSISIMSTLISQYRGLLNTVPSPIMSVSKDFTISYINQSGADLLGKEKKSIIGNKCYDNFKIGVCSTEDCAVAKAMASGKPVSSESTLSSGSQEIPIFCTGTPMKNSAGEIVGAVENITDLSKTKEMEHYLEESTTAMLSEIDKFAHGDLTVHLNPQNNDSIGKLFSGFNEAIKNVKNMILQVTESIQTTANTSLEISQSSNDMAGGVMEQSTQTNELAAAVEEMTKTIFENTQNVNQAAEASNNAGTIAKEGGAVVDQTIEGMNKIADVVQKSAETVQMLGKNSDQIGQIIQVIDDIADQTNLLALNAAIEAARAGEQGRGFAVVADEVRKLAERTTKATKEIADMIKQIQKDTAEAVSTMQQGQNEVEAGKELAAKAGEALNNIISGAVEVVDIISRVAAASEEQSTTSEQISKNIDMISRVGENNSEGIRHMAQASEQLNNLTENLQSMVDQFNTRSESKEIIRTEEESEYAIRKNGKIIKNN